LGLAAREPDGRDGLLRPEFPVLVSSMLPEDQFGKASMATANSYN
jgi:hypothetical protein